MMNTFSSNAPKPLSPGCLTPRHVPREEENTSTIPIRSPKTKKGGGMSTQRALELIRLTPKPKYTGWRSDRQKAEDARAEAKAAEAKAEAEAKKAEAETAPMRNKDGVVPDDDDDDDDEEEEEVPATQENVDNTDCPTGKRSVEKQSPVVAGSDARGGKKARVGAVSKKFAVSKTRVLETQVMELRNELKSLKQAMAHLTDRVRKSDQMMKVFTKNNDSMGSTFRDSSTLRDFLDGYNSRLSVSPEHISKLPPAEKRALRKYVKYWQPFASVFRDCISDFEILFGEKTSEYMNDFEVAMEEALRSDVRSDCPNGNASKLHKSWKTVATEFISASSETREKMRMSWNLKGIMNQMHLKTFALASV